MSARICHAGLAIKAFTHIAAGAGSALIAAEIMHAQFNAAVFLLAGGILGSMLPDIDHPKSAFGSKVVPISTIISGIFGHRGITHSLIALMAVSYGGWHFMREANMGNIDVAPFVAGISAGYLSHLVGDWMTNSGIPLLWPSSKRFVSPIRMFTGDLKEYLLAVLIYSGDVLLLNHLFQ